MKARGSRRAHWPGPLTLVVPLRRHAGIASIVTAGLPTIGIRVPAHAAMQALLRAVGRPLAAPSANASGSISPTRAEHVMKSLGGRIPLIIDGGPTARGLGIDHCRGDRRSAAAPSARPDPARCEGRSDSTRLKRRASFRAITPLRSRYGSMRRQQRRMNILSVSAQSWARQTSARRATWWRQRRACSTSSIEPMHRQSPRIAVAPIPDYRPRRARSMIACRARPLRRARWRSFSRAWKLFLSFCSLGGMIARQ